MLIMEGRLKEGMEAALLECKEGSIIQVWPNPDYENAEGNRPKYILRVIPDGIKPGKEKSSSTGNNTASE